METRCRLCAECSTDQIPILDDLGFCSKIFQLFQIKVSVDDSLPISSCQICYDMVEKTWDFNDRIQKAQEVLTDLLNNITAILNPTDTLETHPLLETQNVLSTQTEVVDLNYLDTKEVIKCDFNLPEESNDLSDSSEKFEQKRKSLKTKGKVPYSFLMHVKVIKKKSKLLDANTLDDIEFEVKDDGTIAPKSDVLGWDTYPWTCCDCKIVFSMSDDLKEHYATSHNSTARYHCADCPKIYSKYSTFLTHVKVHRMKLRFCCDICYKWFPTVSDQEQHRSQHGDERPHACNTCGKKFRMQSALINHPLKFIVFSRHPVHLNDKGGMTEFCLHST
ncbi:hypothetical protein NQ317_017717 [Molorchus minor]|uniref:Uncharacterized protein n=1 Tax=Molorchus minor TaxID=1323400 RepID=A0ABQ9J677_9CUCU|nr:hypothetical protein NQ317_017717 [Molorchus minor]